MSLRYRSKKPSKSVRKASCTVYALVDAERRVRYIGQTRAAPAVRYAGHYKDMETSSAPVHDWMRRGYCTGIEIIQENAIWNYSEALWIKAYREAGARLLNVSKDYDLFYAALKQDYPIRCKISAFKEPEQQET